jgi:hypothetical protein
LRVVLLGDEFLTVPKLTAENPRAIAGLTEQMNQLTGRVDREVSRVDQLIGALMEQQVIENFELVLDEGVLTTDLARPPADWGSSGTKRALRSSTARFRSQKTS